MDLFFDNLKILFNNNSLIFLKNINEFDNQKYDLIYQTEYNQNKYIVLSYKNNKNLKPIISICIPTYNKNNYVLLKSLKEWEKSKDINLNALEFIIVENGSKTYNNELLKEFNLNIILIHIDEGNIGKARKISVESSNSDILFLVNDDTIPTYFLIKNHIKYQIENYYNKLAILGTFKFHEDIIDNYFMEIIKDDKTLFFQNFFEDNIITDAFVTNNISIKKEYIINSGNFSDELKISGEDQDLENRLSKNNIKVLFKQELLSYHYHKHDINSYIKLLKNRYFFDRKINLKYNRYLKKILFDINQENLISSYFFLDYIIKNYNHDQYFKYYILLIHYICILIMDSENNYSKSIKNINKKVLIILEEENNYFIDQTYTKYDIKYINKNTKLYEVLENNYDYFLFTNNNYRLLPYSIDLFILLSENIDKSYKIILGKVFKFNELLNKFFILNENDFFIKKECLINPLFLEETINTKLLLKIKDFFKHKEIDMPCTSMEIN